MGSISGYKTSVVFDGTINLLRFILNTDFCILVVYSPQTWNFDKSIKINFHCSADILILNS